MLDCVAGPDLGDPYAAPHGPRSWSKAAGKDPGKLRIAFARTRMGGGDLHPDVVAAVEAAAKLCQSLGHKVEEASPAVDQDSLFEPFMALWTSGLTMQVDYIAELTGQKPSLDNLEGLTLGLCEAGKQVTAAQYQMALLRIQQVTREVARWHVKYDAWITPTLGKPPMSIGEFDIDEGDVEKGFAPMLDYISFTALQNDTGQPAINLPLCWNADGLPMGTQFVGRAGEEALLLQLATQIETAQPWASRYSAMD